MASFTTTIDGRKIEWKISVDYPATIMLRDLGYDVFSSTSYLGGIFESVPSMVDAAWAIIERQAAGDCITRDDFLRSIKGDTLDKISEALYMGIADFFPERRQKILKLVAEKARIADEEIVTAIERELTSGGTPTNAQEP